MIWYIILLLSLISSSSGSWNDCGSPFAYNTIQQFTVFPDPVEVGDTIYIRAVVQPDAQISGGTVQLRIFYSNDSSQTPIINIPGISLCTLSSQVTCPFDTTQHILSWQFVVPAIPPGEYTVRYDIAPDIASTSCLNFTLQVLDPSYDTTNYTSWYEASLVGQAAYEQQDIPSRTVGNYIQVGSDGYFPTAASSTFPYGTLSEVIGSGDLVPATGLDVTGFVWGLFGNMTSMRLPLSADSIEVYTHIYEGFCYVGYLPYGYGGYENSLFSGSFWLNHTYVPSTQKSTLFGTMSLGPSATLPPGWPSPLLFGTISPHRIITDDNGFLKVMGNMDTCTTAAGCAPVAPSTGIVEASEGAGFTDNELGLTIGLVLGFAFLVVLVVALMVYSKNRAESELEDGVFAVARKPEYGSALVVDDIIQETQGDNRDLRPMLNAPRYEDFGSDNDDDDEYDDRGPTRSDRSRSASNGSLSRSRSGSRSRSSSRSSTRSTASESRSRSRSRARTPPARAPSHSSGSSKSSSYESAEESDPGESASRSSTPDASEEDD